MKILNSIIILSLGLLSTVSTLHAKQPHQLSFQGILNNTQGIPVVDSAYTFTFAIYDAASAGNVVWKESQQIQTQGGAYQTILGRDSSMNVLPFDKTYYVEVMVNNTILPGRNKLIPVPYAISANNVTGSIAPGLAVQSINGLTDGVRIKTDGLITIDYEPDSNAIILTGTAQAIGPQGPDGADGAPGALGTPGDIGPQGEKGDTGYGLKIDETCDSIHRKTFVESSVKITEYSTCFEPSTSQLYVFRSNPRRYINIGQATAHPDQIARWNNADTLSLKNDSILTTMQDTIKTNVITGNPGGNFEIHLGN